MASVRRISGAGSWRTWYLTPAQPIPQLYGRPYDEVEVHKYTICDDWHTHRHSASRHRGSCLSASFEMVASYQDKKSANKKSATLGVSQKAYPNSAEKTYFWNQATIHHFVWSSKERLVQLATAPKKSPNGQNHGVGWISVVTSIHGSGPSWVSQYPAAYDHQVPDYWQTVEDALKVDRLPIVCVGGMTIKSPTHEYDFGEIRLPPDWDPDHDERLFYTPKKQTEDTHHLDQRYQNRPPPGHEQPGRPGTNEWGRAPISKIGPSNPNAPGHAMVISGMYVDSSEKRYVRLLDPSPSMALRESPYRLHEPDPWALDPRNHVKWVAWDELSEHIDRSAGILVFRAENKRKRRKASRDIVVETLGELCVYRENRCEWFTS